MGTTRRQFVRGVSSAAAIAASGAWSDAGAEFPVLNKGVLLPVPNLPRVVTEGQCVWGYRPHRTTGVRLGLAPPRDTPTGKRVYHNYGHGGAGITLSLGCARIIRRDVAQAIDQIRMSGTSPSVAILGSGIIGLTTASEIAKIRPKIENITVYAKDLDLKSTVSWIAGGQFEPSGIWREYADPEQPDKIKRLHEYLKESGEILKAMSADDMQKHGVVRRKNFTLPHDAKDSAFDTGTPRDVVWRPEFGRLPFGPMVRSSGGAVVGNEYVTWLINPQIMMPRLSTDLKASGVKFVAREFRSLDDVAALPAQIVVNCTGLGAGTLFNDPLVYPIKGQLIVLENPQRIRYFFSGGCGDNVMYMFGRQNDLVLGGTYERPNRITGQAAAPGLVLEKCQQFLDVARRVFRGDTNACGVLSREDRWPSS